MCDDPRPPAPRARVGLRRDLPGPRPGRPARCSPRCRAWARRRRGARSSGRRAALPAWRALLARDRARILRRFADLMLDHAGRARPAPDRRAGQAARGVARRDRLRRVVPRVVRRGGEARLRRHDPDLRRRPADRRHEGAGRRHRRDHALELPRGDADAQVRARPRRRLHDGAEARRADTAHGARGRAARSRGRAAGGRARASSPAPPRTRR